MCNVLEGHHVFVWVCGKDAKMPPYLICQCGAFRYDGAPAEPEVRRYVAE